jgi:hypothetical protein
MNIFYLHSGEVNSSAISLVDRKGYAVVEKAIHEFVVDVDPQNSNCSVILIASDKLHEVEQVLEAIKKPGLLVSTRVILVSDDPKVCALGDSVKYDIQDVVSAKTEILGIEKVIEKAIFAFTTLQSKHNIKEFYLDNKFNEVFDWFEQSRWEWSEIGDLSGIDRSLLTDEDIQLLHDGAVVEHTTLPGSHNFLNEWRDEFGFSTWSLMWGAEEARHALVQAKYLKQLGIEVRSKHAMFTRKPYEVGDYPSATLMMNVISEYRAANYYNLRAHRTNEPTLKKIWRLLSKDESRHAKAFYVFCKELCDESDVNMLEALKMAYVWLIDASYGVKHPAGLFFPNADSPDSVKTIEQDVVGDDDNERGDANVYRALRNLTGNKAIVDTRSLKAEIRARM